MHLFRQKTESVSGKQIRKTDFFPDTGFIWYPFFHFGMYTFTSCIYKTPPAIICGYLQLYALGLESSYLKGAPDHPHDQLS